MTEAEWLASGDHSVMLAFVHTKGVDGFRKYRLLLVAYCRTFLPVLLVDERTRRVVEAAEAYSDGVVGQAELAQAKRVARKAVAGQFQLDSAVRGVAHGVPKRQAVDFPYFCLRPWRTGNFNRPTPAQRHRLGQLIRDIFGNPFRPSPPLPPAVLAWNERTIPRLAQAIYEDRRLPAGTLDPARLAMLADALTDAGCTDEELIQHCRSAGPHVRGCWAIDLILGKE